MAQCQVQLLAWHMAWEWDSSSAPGGHHGITGSSKSTVLGQEAWLACNSPGQRYGFSMAATGVTIHCTRGTGEAGSPSSLPRRLTLRILLQTQMSALSSPSSVPGKSPSASTPMAGTAVAPTSAAAGALSQTRMAQLAWVSDSWDTLTPCQLASAPKHYLGMLLHP